MTYIFSDFIVYVAVQYSSEASLKELGLKLGDVFALKALAQKITLQAVKES